MNRTRSILAAVLLLPTLLSAAETAFVASDLVPPPPAREFRAAWIATVANIDWPSKPGLPVAQQKAELVALLDRAAQLHLNAVLFQVRPVCDAFYASPLEPWSEYLTGVQGRAPQPFYDPLALAVAEAHRRGLELHAWFNPFRAAHPEAKSPPARNHVTQTHPEIIRRYGKQIWLDPGEPEAQARAVNAVLDVVKRYDVDGIVFDDYFYPYPEKNRGGGDLDFPDDASWKKSGAASGLSRDDWRRDNVNRLIQRVSQSVKAAKPWVQFGVSPFGIWRPQNPPQIRGLDAYAKLYADARKWLASGWVDYLAPQLYWPVAQREQSFPVLLNWWRAQNPKGRHVFAAVNDADAGKKFSTDEIARQIQIVRAQSGSGGEIHYHLRNLVENPALAASVRAQYAPPALAPATPWLDSVPPEKPRLTVAAGNNTASARWESGGGEPAQRWLLQILSDGVWRTEVLPTNQVERTFGNYLPEAIAIRAVDRSGNLSAPVVLVPKKVLSANTSPNGAKAR
jgi:uncharacterized lipoprotein YddW (UPF0748 family)